MRKVTINGLLARKLRLALTGLAILLGVTFVTGTLILGDTLDRTFNDLVGTAYGHVSFQIRGKLQFGTNRDAAINGNTERRPVPASIVAEVARLPGVAYVHGSVNGYAQFMDRSDNAIGGGGGGSALGFSFDPNQQLSPYRLAAGRAPSGPDDVVMDKHTATKYGFKIGERVLVNLPNRPQRFVITGIVTFGSDDNLAGATLAGFDLQTAQRVFNSEGRFDNIDVLAAPGADNVKLQSAISKVLPGGVQVVSGQQVVNELTSAVDHELSFISIALLVFALISLFVGGFTIFNTFSITIGQRTRELALLRVVGASRRQLFASVLGEAALTGLIASLLGLGFGVLAALGLKALLKAFGIVLPAASLVFEARTVLVALAVGIGVTVVSAILPARQAVRIPPVAALQPQSEERPTTLRRRVIAGTVIALLGVVLVIAGLAQPAAALVGLGALAEFAAATLLVPILARPLASGIGRPLAAVFGTPARIGRENSMRNPRRTAQTAAALMIGIALVSTIAVLGASLSTSAKDQVDSAISADYLVTGKGEFSKSAVTAVSRLPGVQTATTIYQGQFEFRGSLNSLVAATPANLDRTVRLHLTAGTSSAAMTSGELLIDTTTAESDGLHVGSVVPAKFARTGDTTMRIGGIFEPNPLVGSFVVGAPFFLAHFDNPLPTGVLLSTAPGTRDLGPALNRALIPYANVGYKTRAQFEQSQENSINQLLGLVYVLLALAVLVALIGVVNTLILSVFERTREIGLLRAVGMKRGQVKRMIRSEAVIISLLGGVVGIVVGTALGLALASSLRRSGVTNVAVPVVSLIGFLILSALLGLVAAGWPARRAAKLDVLAAIATE
jgi:putative ABC transport system permease protein